MSTQEHTQVLDQLQREVNLILEQTGRLFAAADPANKGTNPGVALARASRLKQLMPVSNNRFHDALDILDEELQIAKAVMRRDLALCRRKEGKQVQADGPAPVQSVQQIQPVQPVKIAEAEPAPLKPSADEVKAAAPAPKQPLSPEAEAVVISSSSPMSKKRSSPPPEDSTDEEPPIKKMATEKLAPETAKGDAKDEQPVESKLQLETRPIDLEESNKPKSDDENGPATGTYSNNADLDSLFNDPTSAGGLAGDNNEGTDFGTGPNTGNDFDFATFNASIDEGRDENEDDDDNISALLPGLSDYANGSNVESDFSALFAAEPTAGGDDAAVLLGDAQTHGSGQRDTTFDDFMDLTFDMSGDGNEAGGANQEFNFDFN